MLIYCRRCCDNARKNNKIVKATKHIISVPSKKYLVQSIIGRGGKTDYCKIKCTKCNLISISDLSHD